MADIELVIRISEEKYKDIQGRDWKNGKKWFSEEWQAIHNGTPLPKGHGRLIDADEIDNYMLPSEKQDNKTWFVHSEEYRNAVLHFNHAMRLLKDNAPTIIEADKGSEK